MFRMLIGSDLVPTTENFDLFEAGDTKGLLGEKLSEMLNEVDFRIFNLETPICDKETPISKCGPNLIAPTRTMPGIKAINPSLLALSNNHILDHGDEGLFETIRQLEKWDIPYVGVGKNLAEAKKPYIIESDGKKIGIYNCAEHEFTIANDNKAGANPFDAFESLDHIVDLKAECDYVVVLYHGGKEYYPYPSPYLQKVCRKIADKGADLVICQHTHCIGCKEDYNGSTIVYGQGNFLFSKKTSYTCWLTSILINVEFSNEMKVEFIPIYTYENGVRLAENEKAEEILRDFYLRSEEILTPGFIAEKYNEFVAKRRYDYFYAIAGGKEKMRISYEEYEEKYSDYSISSLVKMWNFLVCEPHHELVTTAIKNLIEEKSGEKI